MSDVTWLLAVLADGRDHALDRIIQRSQEERGHGLTVHSRVSDLRKLGYRITTWRTAVNKRRPRQWYRLENPPRREEDVLC